MNQDVQKRRKRTVNFTVGIILAALHAAAPANSLMNNSLLEWVSDSALMASVVKAGMIAGGAGVGFRWAGAHCRPGPPKA
jgi:hypothetical protein